MTFRATLDIKYMKSGVTQHDLGACQPASALQALCAIDHTQQQPQCSLLHSGTSLGLSLALLQTVVIYTTLPTTHVSAATAVS
jgi:hypothetical protein